MLLLTLAFAVIAGDIGNDTATITLRAAVRIAADAENVRLADVAVIKGEDATRLGDVVIGPAPRHGTALEVSIRQIRNALDEAGVHWGRTHLNGRAVTVRANPGSGVSAPMPMATISLLREDPERPAPAARERPAPTPHVASTLLADEDLRSAIAEFMVQNLTVDADALQITFDERDGELLQTPLATGRFQIEPVSNVRSARLEVAIRRWEGDRIVDRHTLNIAPAVRVPVATVKRDVDRGVSLTSDDVEMREHWLAPNAIAGIVSDSSSIVGRLTSTRLREGDLVRETHLQREMIVRRGELVIVRCIVGGAVISLQAEARANAAAGETIEFRKPGDRDTFLATVTGRGVAVVDLARRHQ